MAIQLKAGQKVRIGGLEYTVETSHSQVYNGKRLSSLTLKNETPLDEIVEDVKPVEVPANIEEAIDSLTQVFKRWGISLEDFAK